MKTLIKNFSGQLREAVEIAKQAKLTSYNGELKNVLISGLGGSGIGGTLVAELCENGGTIPVLVNKKYQIPSFIGPNTLFIASSYSGNTEETIEATLAAKEKGAKIVCVSSGGRIIEMAKENNWDYVIVPGGNPPRACLGYSLVQLLNILSFNKITSDIMFKQLEEAIKLIDAEEENIQKEAKEIAKKLVGKIPVIYTLSLEAVAVRFRQQINENGKNLCWHHVIPEMNHNELVGWTDINENLAVLVLRNSSDFYRNVKRLEVNLDIISKYTKNITTLNSKGNNTIEEAIYLIHLTDWVSCFLADEKGVDVMEVKVIDHLKGELSKI
jgi:glucose/mannose-6-phosphate isomerase